MKDATIEKIREFFKDDTFAWEQAGVRIDEATAPDSPEGLKVVCSMVIGREHKNAVGIVMGGAIYTLADFCFAVATNAFEDGAYTVTLSSNIQYLSPCKGTKLIATLVPLHKGRSTVAHEVRVEDDLGNLVAKASTTGFRRELKR